jgi:hypothetical protein
MEHIDYLFNEETERHAAAEAAAISNAQQEYAQGLHIMNALADYAIQQ